MAKKTNKQTEAKEPQETTAENPKATFLTGHGKVEAGSNPYPTGQKILDQPVLSAIRWMGANDFGLDDARDAIEALGGGNVTVTEFQIRNNLLLGQRKRDRWPVADFGPDEIAQVMKFKKAA